MKKYSVVIVEDDEDERLFMKKGFDASGLFDIVKQAKNGDELLEWFGQQRGSLPDFILTDLNMFGKNGYDILDFIKANPGFSHIPVIVLTTAFARFTTEKCTAKGAVLHLNKPETFLEYAPFACKLHELIQDKQLIK